MSDGDYAKWKDFQRAATDALAIAEAKRGAGDFPEWEILFKRAIILQELAVNFAKTFVQ